MILVAQRSKARPICFFNVSGHLFGPCFALCAVFKNVIRELIEAMSKTLELRKREERQAWWSVALEIGEGSFLNRDNASTHGRVRNSLDMLMRYARPSIEA